MLKPSSDNKELYNFSAQTIIELQDEAQIIDADFSETYGVVYLKRDREKMTLHINYQICRVDLPLDYPFIRWVNNSMLILVEPRCDQEDDNIWVLGRDGSIKHQFHGGDAIENILATKSGIWIGYGDEGTFGDGISTEGLVCFSYEGKILFRYQQDLVNPPTMVDSEVMAASDTGVWILPSIWYPLINIDESHKLRTYKVPRILHEAKAISVRKNRLYVQGKNEVLYVWEIDSRKKAVPIKSFHGDRIRGIQEGGLFCFLQIKHSSIILHRCN